MGNEGKGLLQGLGSNFIHDVSELFEPPSKPIYFPPRIYMFSEQNEEIILSCWGIFFLFFSVSDGKDETLLRRLIYCSINVDGRDAL